MTPKEKAKELVDRFEHFSFQYWSNLSGWDMESKRENAKQCALIACNEISMTNPTIKGTSEDLLTMIVQTKAYWIQVEQEISLL